MSTAEFEDIRYEVDGPAAVVMIARPERYNAFRGQNLEELSAAFRAAGADRSVRVVILTGEGDKAFCSGSDVKQRAETGDYGPTNSRLWEVDCRQYDAATAERRGPVDAVVPPDQVLPEAKRWAAEIAQMIPTAIRFLKHSFNADTDHQGGIGNVAAAGLDLFVETDKGREGALAFTAKRKPDFARCAR